SVGDTSPLMIWRISESISSWKISLCSITRTSASCGVTGFPPAGSMEFYEVAQQVMAELREYRLRMKLDALNRQAAVANPHDFTVVGPRRDFEHLRQRFTLDDE